MVVFLPAARASEEETFDTPAAGDRKCVIKSTDPEKEENAKARIGSTAFRSSPGRVSPKKAPALVGNQQQGFSLRGGFYFISGSGII